MKILYVKNLIAILGFALACVACNKEEYVETANIVMTTDKACSNFDFFLSGSGMAVIDWGDGSTNDTLELQIGAYNLINDYNSEDSYTVRVYGENITDLSIYNNDLKTLDVRSVSLESLSCGNGSSINRTKSLDLRKSTALTSLVIRCPIKSIDLSKNTALRRLNIYGDQITSIDLRKNTALEYLDCGTPQLNNLYLSANNKVLKLLVLNVPLFTAYKLNTLFASLPFLETKSGYISIFKNPGTDSCDISIAEKKGWIVRIF